MKFWNGLNSREQAVIGLGLPLVLVVAVYLYYWQPAKQHLDNLRIQVPQKTAELAWVRHEIGKAEQWLGARASGGENQAILTIIEIRAIASGVKASIQRVQPTNAKEVQMWFREAPADGWLNFVNLLRIDGISVESATLTRAKLGRINVRVTFSR
jgi:type II secretory pathway component PulM